MNYVGKVEEIDEFHDVIVVWLLRGTQAPKRGRKKEKLHLDNLDYLREVKTLCLSNNNSLVTI